MYLHGLPSQSSQLMTTWVLELEMWCDSVAPHQVPGVHSWLAAAHVHSSSPILAPGSVRSCCFRIGTWMGFDSCSFNVWTLISLACHQSHPTLLFHFSECVKDRRQLTCYTAQFHDLSPHLIFAPIQAISVTGQLRWHDDDGDFQGIENNFVFGLSQWDPFDPPLSSIDGLNAGWWLHWKLKGPHHPMRRCLVRDEESNSFLGYLLNTVTTPVNTLHLSTGWLVYDSIQKNR